MSTSIYLYGDGSASTPASATPTFSAGGTTHTSSTAGTTNYVATISNYATLNALSGATWATPTAKDNSGNNVGTVSRSTATITVVVPIGYEGVINVGIGFTDSVGGSPNTQSFGYKSTVSSLAVTATPVLNEPSTFTSRTDIAQTYNVPITNYSGNYNGATTWAFTGLTGGVTGAYNSASQRLEITVPANFDDIVSFTVKATATGKAQSASSSTATTDASLATSATPTITGGTTVTEGSSLTFNVTPVAGASYTWSADEGSITPSGASAVWTPASTGSSRTATITCVVTEAGKLPSTADTHDVAVTADFLSMDGLVAYWDFSDASVETDQVNQTFTSSDVNTTTGNLTISLPFDTHPANPNAPSIDQLAVEVTFASTGTLPAPLVAGTPYYCRKNTAGTEIEIYPKISTNSGGTLPFTVPEEYTPPCLAFYLAEGRIALTTGGTGTHTVTTNPLLKTVPSKKSIGMPISNTNSNLNVRNELKTAGDGKKYLHGKGVLAKRRNFTSIEGVSKQEKLNFVGTDQAIYRETHRNKRFMYLQATVILHDQYIMDCRKNILAPSNVNTNGTITFTGHGFPTGPTGVTEVRCTATSGSSLPTNMPATAYLKGVTANTYTLHPTMADAVATTNVITYANTGSGNFIINSKTDVASKPYEGYPFSVDFAVDYDPASGNGSGSQRVVAFTQNGGNYGALVNAGPTNTQTPTLCDSLKRIAGIMNTGAVAGLQTLPQLAYPVRVRTNGTYPLRTDATGGRLNPATTYWAVPLNNSSSNLCWLFDSKALADAWIATSPANSGNPANGITLSNTDYYGRLQWYVGNNMVNMCQSNIIPSTTRTGLVPLEQRITITRVLDLNNPSYTHWTHSLYVNTTPVYTNALFNNSDPRLKGLLNGAAIPSANILFLSPAEPHVGCEIDIFQAAFGTSNTDPTTQLLNGFLPAVMSEYNIA